MANFLIRATTVADIAAITAIYAEYVVVGTASFEIDAPDLMLVDVQLPRKNGFELVREIRGLPSGNTTKILLMSAVYTDRDQSSRTIQLGTLADGYLSKPFDLVQLLTTVRQLLGEA